MNIMVDRETVVSTINKFIQKNNLEDIVTLFDYLCEIKEIPNKDREQAVKAVTVNPLIISLISNRTLEDLEIHFHICRVTDKNHKIISVF